MSEQQNIQVIKDAYGAYERGDIESILASLTDNVDWYLPGPEVIPGAGRFKGKDAVAQWFPRLADAEEVMAFEAKEFFAAGDTVVVLGHYAAKVKATGRKNEFDWVHVFRFQGGKVSSWEQFNDTATSAEAYRSSAQSETGVIGGHTVAP